MPNNTHKTTYDFSGSVVIVTGGANGIGRAICQGFARAGANVLCLDLDPKAGQELASQDNAPGTVVFRQSDIAKADDCRAAIEDAVARWGGIDIICNNAGIQPRSSYLPVHELSEEMWDRILDVNLKSTYFMSHYGIPHLKARGGGTIINTASVQGMASANLVSAYAASKGGLISLTRQLALDYGVDNIRVLGVAPGTIDTGMARLYQEHTADELEAMYEDWGKRHPIGHHGQPNEIAQVVMFLASDQASFMTGETVCVDGGLMAKGAWA
jgi:NAD(P)-dependent dehydrogenase (short-subunit alcohol dehydrogenase family)